MREGPDLRQWIRQYVARLTGVDARGVELDRSIDELGLDSVDAVIMAGELEEAFGVPVDPAAFLRHPTLEAMVRALSPGEGSGRGR